MNKQENLERIKKNVIHFNQKAGNALRSLRIKKGFTLKKLSLETMRVEEINGKKKFEIISEQTINQWENGVNSISLEKLDRLCVALGTNIAEFTKLI